MAWRLGLCLAAVVALGAAAPSDALSNAPKLDGAAPVIMVLGQGAGVPGLPMRNSQASIYIYATEGGHRVRWDRTSATTEIKTLMLDGRRCAKLEDQITALTKLNLATTFIGMADGYSTTVVIRSATDEETSTTSNGSQRVPAGQWLAEITTIMEACASA